VLGSIYSGISRLTTGIRFWERIHSLSQRFRPLSKKQLRQRAESPTSGVVQKRRFYGAVRIFSRLISKSTKLAA
jgi:hypothetical protein